MQKLNAIELCAGAGGQALGLEMSGFEHSALIEIDSHCCNTLRANRPGWNVVEQDLREFDGTPYQGIDLLAAGLPCPPFSKAGKQLGDADERNLFPEGIRLVRETMPRAVMIENVRGILDAVFEDYRITGLSSPGRSLRLGIEQIGGCSTLQTTVFLSCAHGSFFLRSEMMFRVVSRGQHRRF